MVVVIGGLGSFWGTFLGALDLRPGALVRHPVLPALLDLLGLRPDGGGAHHPPVGPARAAAQVMRARAVGARSCWRPRSSCPRSARASTRSSPTTSSIWALFATSLNLLVGYTGLVSFGHAAYFGIGAYTTGILMKKLGVPFLARLRRPPASSRGALRPRLRLLLRAAHPDLLRHADARLRADRVGHLLQVERGDRRRAGHARDPLPEFRLDRARRPRVVPFVGGYRTSEYFYFLTLVLVGVCFWLLRRIVSLAVRAHADDDPRERRARGVHRGQRAALRAGRLRPRRRRSRASPAASSASSTAASSPTSPTGPSRPRC